MVRIESFKKALRINRTRGKRCNKCSRIVVVERDSLVSFFIIETKIHKKPTSHPHCKAVVHLSTTTAEVSLKLSFELL